MKVKLNTILKNVYGEPIKSQRKKPQSKAELKEKKAPELEDLTLKHVIVNALLAEFEAEANTITGEDKLRRYRLAMTVMDGKAEIELEAAQVVEIKDLIGKGWSPLIAGQSWELIEPK